MIITGAVFEIKIDGQNLSSSAHSNIKKILVHQQVNQSTALTIYFGWDYYYKFQDKFSAGRKIQLWLPFRNNPVLIFNGTITGMFWESDYITGQHLRVEAKDALLELRHVGFEFSMEKYSLLQLIREIGASVSFSVEIENVVDIRERFVIPASSKLDALKALCDEFGLNFYLKENILSIFSPEQNPYDPMDFEINPVIPHILSNSVADSFCADQRKYVFLLERDNQETGLLKRKEVYKIGGNNESDYQIIGNIIEGMTVSEATSYYQSHHEDLIKQQLTCTSLREKVEFRIPGNPLIHPGKILRIKDEQFFLTGMFVKKAVHQWDHQGFTSTLECFANSRR